MFGFRLRFHWRLFLRVQITNFPALVQIMAWRHPGDKPLSETMLVSLPTDICVTRPQWINIDMAHVGKIMPHERQELVYPTQAVSCLLVMPLLLTWINSAWINYHMPSKVWVDITRPFPNFKSCTIEVWEWTSNSTPSFIMDVITYPCWC